MRHRNLTLAAAALTALLAHLSGCVTTTPPRAGNAQPVPNPYTPYAGQPIREFTWLGGFYSWDAVSSDELVVFTTPSDAYLLRVWSTCENLRFIIHPIGLTTTSGTVRAGLDAVRTGRMSCPIEEIRRIDYPRMLADLRLAARKPAPSSDSREPGA